MARSRAGAILTFELRTDEINLESLSGYTVWACLAPHPSLGSIAAGNMLVPIFCKFVNSNFVALLSQIVQ